MDLDAASREYGLSLLGEVEPFRSSRQFGIARERFRPSRLGASESGVYNHRMVKGDGRNYLIALSPSRCIGSVRRQP